MSDLFLLTTLYGSSDLIKSLDGVNPDIDVLPPQNPIEKFVTDREFERELEKTGGAIFDSSWNEPIGVSAPLEKHFRNPLGFKKGSLGFKLGVVRQEREVHDDGTVWNYGYDGNDEMVGAMEVREES